MADEFSALLRQAAANMSSVADSTYPASIARAVELLFDTFMAGGKLLVFGNGGSAADAQHFAAEFVGRFAGSGVRFQLLR